MVHPARLPIEELLADCKLQRTRRSGPGGQHRNKVETAVVVEHLATGMRAEANERRSQEQNRQAAIQRLRIKLAMNIRTPPPHEMSGLWLSRRVGDKLTVSAEHGDFPALLAEALDTISAEDFDLPRAASLLGVSSSQLLKLLRVEPAALTLVNRERTTRGRSPYR